MKIAVLVYSLYGIGGVPKYTLHLSREFAAMGHQVAVWSVECNDECYPELTQGLDIQALRPARLPTDDETRKPAGIRMLAYMWSLGSYYQDQRRLSADMPGGYDVINPHGDTISWAAAEYKRKHGTPVVWMCTDFWPMTSQRYAVISSARERIKNLFKKSLCFPFDQYDQAAVRRIDEIAVLSNRVKSQMS